MTEADRRNVELIRRGLAAFSSGEFDAALADTHSEIEWHVTFRLPDLPHDKPVYEGHDEVLELWEAFTGAWDSIGLEVEDVIVARAGYVVARTRFRGRGEASGIEVDRVVHYLFIVEDELLRSIQPFDSEAEALRAAGLADAG